MGSESPPLESREAVMAPSEVWGIFDVSVVLRALELVELPGERAWVETEGAWDVAHRLIDVQKLSEKGELGREGRPGLEGVLVRMCRTVI